MEFFLDLAWDIKSKNETSIEKHLEDWSAREFGNKNAEEIANVMDEYFRLAFLRKPEFMGWSRTEPKTETRNGEFTQNEAQRRLEAYAEFIKK